MKSPILCCLDSRATDNGSLYGRFLLGPFPIDLSLTVATTLRRGLLHSQPSFGIVSAEIEGAVHEYASLPGVQESVLELLLNLGEVVLTTTHRNLLERSFRNTGLLGSGIYIASLRFSGPGFVKAKDINWPDGIYCVNPDVHIATLSTNEILAMRIKIVAAFEDQTTSLLRLSNKKQTTCSLQSKSSAQAKVKDNAAIKSSSQDTESFGKKSKDDLVTHVLQSKNQKAQEIEHEKIGFDQNSVTIFASSENPNSTTSLATAPLSTAKGTKEATATITKTSGDSHVKMQENFGIKTLRSGLASPTLFGLKNNLRAKTVRPQKLSFDEKQNKDHSVYESSERTFLQLLALQSKQSQKKQETNQIRLKKDQNVSVREFLNIDSFVKTGETQVRGVELAVSPCSYPVQKVNFVIERDDQWEGYRHRIILEVWTNGSISPRQAIFDTVAWTIKLLYSFRDPTRFSG